MLMNANTTFTQPVAAWRAARSGWPAGFGGSHTCKKPAGFVAVPTMPHTAGVAALLIRSRKQIQDGGFCLINLQNTI